MITSQREKYAICHSERMWFKGKVLDVMREFHSDEEGERGLNYQEMIDLLHEIAENLTIPE